MDFTKVECPNCGFTKNIESSKLPAEPKNLRCSSCNKTFFFEPTKIEKASNNKKFTLFTKLNIFIGTTLFLAYYLPVGQIFGYFTKGMYGPFFRNYSPALYHLVNVTITYTITALILYFAFNKIGIFQRLNRHYTSQTLFSIGNAIIIIYLAIRIFASTIPGGGPPLAVSIIGVYPVLFAKLCLGIAVCRILIGIEPITPPNKLINRTENVAC